MRLTESRNSKRSVVFSKNKNQSGAGTGQLSSLQVSASGQASKLQEGPSTPGSKSKIQESFNTQVKGQYQLTNMNKGQQLPQPNPVLSGTNTQIRVNQIPNTVKVTKTIKNIVY